MHFSRQIRAPIYSLKQTKLRKRRVVRFAITYFAMLILFVLLIFAPIIIGKKTGVSLGSVFGSGALAGLSQPTGYSNNDTNYSPTGWATVKGGLAADPSATAEVARRAQLHW